MKKLGKKSKSECETFTKRWGKVQWGLPTSPSSSVVTCRLSRELHLSPPHSPGHRKLSIFRISLCHTRSQGVLCALHWTSRAAWWMVYNWGVILLPTEGFLNLSTCRTGVWVREGCSIWYLAFLTFSLKTSKPLQILHLCHSCATRISPIWWVIARRHRCSSSREQLIRPQPNPPFTPPDI